MLSESIQNIFDIVANPDSTTEEVAAVLNAAIGDFYATESPDEIEVAQTQLTHLLDGPTDENSQFAVVLNGYLIEAGFPTGPLVKAYDERLPQWIAGALRLSAHLPEPSSGDEDEAEAEANEAAHEQQFEKIAQENPRDYDCWNRLESFYLPLVAALSVDKNARVKFRHYLDQISPLEETMASAHYLTMLLDVLYDEPILVLEPSTSQGFEGRINGVVENFQLHMLLQKVFQELDGQPRITPQVAEVAVGEGEQAIEVEVEGSWDMREWTVLRPDGNLPLDYLSGVIWGEGRPSHIAVFEGRRVVILAPPSYQRFWQAQRTFSKLKANIEIDKVLSAEEVKGWIAKLTA